MATDAQHQASYRARLAAAGNVRLDTHISADAHAALTTLAQREGTSARAVVEAAIFSLQGAPMKTQFRRDDPATNPCGSRSTKPALATIRLTAEELAARKPVSPPATPRKDETPMSSTTPQRPPGMSAGEILDLERFRRALPNLSIALEQVQRAHAFNGGDAGAQRKAAFEAQLNASNQHRK